MTKTDHSSQQQKKKNYGFHNDGLIILLFCMYGMYVSNDREIKKQKAKKQRKKKSKTYQFELDSKVLVHNHGQFVPDLLALYRY